MSEMQSKLGVYDFLVMLVPGCVIMFLLLKIPAMGDVASSMFESLRLNDLCIHNVDKAAAFVVAAYMIGLLNHSIQDLLWPVLKNDPIHIKYIDDKHSLQKNKETKTSINVWWRCLILRGLIILLRNMSLIVPKLNSCKCISKLFDDSFTRVTNDIYIKSYYKAEKRPRSSIGYLEYQVQFIRNMLMPVFISAIVVNGWMFVAIVVLYFLMIERQEKIYACVIEDSTYYIEESK